MRALVPILVPLVLTACPGGHDLVAQHEAASSSVLAAETDSVCVLPGTAADRPAEFPGLPNVVAYFDGLYSGGAPEGPVGFGSLESLGIRTVISVDGTVPDVEEATKHGLRYVHLPITYSGMDKARTLEIARAVSDLPGPVYIHCHHGKHRSAAAAGAASVTLGRMSAEEARQRLVVSGAAPAFNGLWKCVAVATPVSRAELDSASHAFPETSPPEGLVSSMVAIDEDFDSLKSIQKAGWKSSSPDLVPMAIAASLEGHFRELGADRRWAARPSDFHDWLRANQETSLQIEEELNAPAPSAEILTAGLERLDDTCNACHAKYRN
jgi:protein tyrosine phosphatase (PTP) superfamily phosphohydrolase (DUF442 family)